MPKRGEEMKRIVGFAVLVAALLFLAGCTVVVNPVEYGSLRGYVYISSSPDALSSGVSQVVISASASPQAGYVPLKGAEVRLTGADNPVEYTDRDGAFYFPRVRAGWQTITVEYDALRTTLRETIRIRPNDPNPQELELVAGVGFYLVVGINTYKHLPAIVPDNPDDGPIADANLVYTAFEGTTWKKYLRKMTGSAATKAAILNAIDEMSRAAQSEDDYLVFYFSGYTGKDYISPYDADGSWDREILDGELEKAFSRFPGEVIVILDGAQSGSMADKDPWYPDPRKSASFEPLALAKDNYTVIASSRPFDPAIGFPDEQNESVFTFYFVDGLQSREADGYGRYGTSDGIITAREIFDYVSDEMEQLFRTYPFLEEHRPYMWSVVDGRVPIYRYR